jgi:hypothetical protein
MKKDMPATDPGKPDAPVEGAVKADEVSTTETLAQGTEGVAKAGSSQTPATPSDEWKSKFEELKDKYEKDIGKVKSALDSKLTSTVKTSEEKERALQQQLDELRKTTMNEVDYKEYERNRAFERIDELQKQVDAERTEKEQLKQFNNYVDLFMNKFDIPRSELKIDGSLEELYNSGMAALVDRHEKSKANPATAKPKEGKNPPPVAQPSSTPAAGVLSLEELAKKYAGGSVDKLFALAERRLDIAALITEAARKQTQ